MDWPGDFATKYPVQKSDGQKELVEACTTQKLIIKNYNYNAQNELFSSRLDNAYRYRSLDIDEDSEDEYQDYQEYRQMILDRPRGEATRQLKVSQDISSRNLYGPAAIQAPNQLQILANSEVVHTKANSQVMSSFDYIKALLSMMRAQGLYFESLPKVIK